MEEIESDSRYYTKNRNPKYWGFFLWNSWEAQMESYPETSPSKAEQDELFTWMHLNFRRVPCEKCRAEALELWKKFPMPVTSQATAKEWLRFIKNQVNEKLGKPQLSPKDAESHSQLIRHVNWTNVWQDLKSGKVSMPGSSWGILSYVALFLLVLVFVAVCIAWMRDIKRFSALEKENSVEMPIFANHSTGMNQNES